MDREGVKSVHLLSPMQYQFEASSNYHGHTRDTVNSNQLSLCVCLRPIDEFFLAST